MKDKIITYLFIIYILLFSIFHIITEDKEISKTERRELSSFPVFTLNNEYIKKIDKYFLDHFPLRENLRSLKAKYNYNILNKLDNNKIYVKDNYIYKSEYPTNKESINNFINHINKTKNNFTNNNNIYIMIIPDKNYYLKDNSFLQLDYDYIYNKINELNIKTIDLRNILNIEDYYQTDTHWRQENLDKVVKEMTNSLSLPYQNQIFVKNEYNNFYGVYYGQSAIKREPETITYLTNKTINNVKVKYLENSNLSKIYNLDKLDSLDPYEVYLDGASSHIEIINDNSITNRELIIYRDSFASSLAPLLVNYYQKITLIDNRYIFSSNYLKQLEFANQDIMFIYSTLLVNNSYSIKNWQNKIILIKY